MTEPVCRGFHPLTVVAVVEETADARSYVLEVPLELRPSYTFAAGQYLTFRLPVGDEPALRCYSMSSAPETGEPLRTTVKRVAGGLGSNWLIDTVAVGDVLEATTPAGSFVVVDEPGPLVAFTGGSGITPVLSIVKATLATTDRPVRLLYANRDRRSVIFAAELAALEAVHPERLSIHHHLDDTDGFVTDGAISAFLAGDTDVHVYLCGPTPFMDLVEAALGRAGVAAELVRSERFVVSDITTEPDRTDAVPSAAPGAGTAATATVTAAVTATGTVVLTLLGITRELPQRPGDTILDTARRGGLNPPFSCQLGNCATCMARVSEGAVRMRANGALSAEEVAEGWVLTCLSVPTTPLVRVVYEP